MSSRKVAGYTVWCIIILIMLSACTDSRNGSEEIGGKAEESEKDVELTPNQEPIELYFRLIVGSITTEERFMEVFGNLIKEKYSYITPKFIPADQTLKTIIETGQQIDIFYDSFANSHSNLLQYEMQYDISDLIGKTNYDLSRLEKTSVQAQKQLADGGMFGLPVSVDTIAMVYNRGLFDRFGYDYPKDVARA